MVSRAIPLLVALAVASPAASQAGPTIPTPESHFGFVPGSHRRLADWHDLLSYYDRVAATSPRIAIDTLGSSTRGLPLVALVITSEENHARLDEIRDIHLKLADPRLVSGPDELAQLKESARVIVLVTSHIHATEVGAGQMPANLLYRLATSTDPEVEAILNQTVVILVPSLNPDGTQMVADWYRTYLGTRFEGMEPVDLYHEYVGHDNNRDWYALTQVETQLVVEKVHNRWRPVIVHDVHQMEQNGPRMFVPPYIDPFERNVDPLLISAINQAGSYMAAELALRGFTGVSTSIQFDLFTPARAYSHYHGGVRILSETASARLASPVNIRRAEPGAGTPSAPTMNAPLPWEGESWGLPQIVAYQEAGVMALLTNAARNREYWIDNFATIAQRAVDKWEQWPSYWLLPETDGDRTGLDAVLRILTLGSVEVRRAKEPFHVGERRFEAGTYVIPMQQPYAAWAQTLLERQQYPNFGSGTGSSFVRPYDVTAHTLPLLMGVEAIPVGEGITVELSAPIEPVSVHYAAPSWLTGRSAPRIGLYRGSREPPATGWTRWLFDQHGVEYVSLSDEDVRRGDLGRRLDVIILQDQPQLHIIDGWQPGEAPDEYTGGIGADGLYALGQFVRNGGRLVAIESATELAIEFFGLAVENALESIPLSSFYIPGSILRLDLEPTHPINRGLGPETSAWFWHTSRAFRTTDPRARVVARYGRGNPRLSGWAMGAEHLAGLPAILEVPVGRGSVILFGFQPNYRGQSIATWPLLFGALR